MTFLTWLVMGMGLVMCMRLLNSGGTEERFVALSFGMHFTLICRAVIGSRAVAGEEVRYRRNCGIDHAEIGERSWCGRGLANPHNHCTN